MKTVIADKDCRLVGVWRCYNGLLNTLSLMVTLFDAFAKREDPDQPAPTGAVWSGSSLFAYWNLVD